MTPAELRLHIARREWTTPTAGMLDDYQQADQVIDQQANVYTLPRFCLRNPKADPMMAAADTGDPGCPRPEWPLISGPCYCAIVFGSMAIR